MTAPSLQDRVAILYLAPWVDYGGSDKGTIDWFRWLDRARFAPSLVTTLPSSNRRLAEVAPYAEEIWPLPDLVAGPDMPGLVFDIIATRRIELLHVMNSRLAFELLPDLASLPHPPKVVVQLHVEEQDRSGYVQLVARRYGNLVDAFSVSSEYLAPALEGYDIPRAKIRVIRTGVDSEVEFVPDRVTPVAGFDPAAVHVLYPARLVDQKDPLLMVEVAAHAVAQRDDLRFHVVGDGPLEDAVRDAVTAKGLARQVLFHPPTRGLATWYRASDILLMTSVFEGVPQVAYEAMAMGLPIVAPALPGTLELIGDENGVLVEPRDDIEAYARALLELAGDSKRRAEIGLASRRRTLEELSVRTMARSHEALYDELVSGAAGRRPRPGPFVRARPEFTRERRGHPLVSVIVPCFNHGRYLRACLESIRAQTWSAIEVIVVDDGSTDPLTREVLADLETSDDVRVLRMDGRQGPGRARNTAIDRARGRYILPLDADNLLMPDAVEHLVEQLRNAPGDVGFIYPNLQYFGTRRDYFDAPDYNLFWLLEGNFCDTCSLFDADVFLSGVRYDDQIMLGHEDWDLVLTMASAGIRGEPARSPTLFYRKSGFNRSDSVEYARQQFSEVLHASHPELFGSEEDWGRYGWHSGPAVSIKSHWSPALTVIALTPVDVESDEGVRLRDALERQTYRDFDVILRSETPWPDNAAGIAIRRIPAELAGTAAEVLEDALRVCRAPLVLVTAGTAADLLLDSAFLEKLLRSRAAGTSPAPTILSDVGERAADAYDLQVLEPSQVTGIAPHTVLFGASEIPWPLAVAHDAPVDSLARVLVSSRPVKWRHMRAEPAPMACPGGPQRILPPLIPPVDDRTRREIAHRRFPQQPALPALLPDAVRRWGQSTWWMPPQTKLLVRHRAIESEDRAVTNGPSPPGFTPEWVLGSVHVNGPVGTAELRVGGETGFTVIPDEDGGAPRLREPRHPDSLGFIEQAPLALLDALQIAWFPPAQQWVLLTSTDPMQQHVEDRRWVGYVEAYPNHPELAPPTQHTYGLGLTPLLRTVDRSTRRHRYGVGSTLAGELSMELGEMHTERQPDSVAVWLVDDRVLAEDLNPSAPRPDARTLLRYVASPMKWRKEATLSVPESARGVLERAVDTLRPVIRSSSVPAEPPDGFLWRTEGDGRRAIYAARHPVTGDQLVTPWPTEAADMGYVDAQLLGYLWTSTASTGTRDRRHVDVPWASRFGRRVRLGAPEW
jgi:glycosyltransferase involved in cell wall biosynthesis